MSTGDTTSSIDNIGLGDYTVTVTDANGCIDSETITVTEPLEYVSSYVTNVYNSFGVSCNGSTDGSIDVTVVGGTSHSYLWSTGATTEEEDSIGAGTYVITATDTNGCPTTQTVTITEPDSLLSTYTTSDWNGYDIQCSGGDNGEITMGVTGGVDFLPYTYDIDGVSNGSNIFSPLSEGTSVFSDR